MGKINVGDLRIGNEEKNAINKVLDSGRISEWKNVKRFENKFAKYIGTKYCILVNSGTSALIAGLLSLIIDERYPKFKKGAKIITTPVTYIATSNAIRLAGLQPVYVDINPFTFDIDTEKIEEILKTSNPDEYAAILPVHLMGYPCDMDRINEIACRYGLLVFEDSAQAHGTLYKGKKVGTFSILSDYSFYIAHNIQVGEMGALVTDDEELYRIIKKIKANGRTCDCTICTRQNGYCKHEDLDADTDNDPRFLHDLVGYNFKTMEFQAALGLLQLDKVEDIICKRQENVKAYNEMLVKYSDILQLPIFSKNVSYIAYPIVIKNPDIIPRKLIRKRLEQYGIESRPLFGCIPTQQPAYADLKSIYLHKLPNAEYVGKNGFYIGCHQYMNQDDIAYVGECFKKILGDLI